MYRVQVLTKYQEAVNSGITRIDAFVTQRTRQVTPRVLHGH